MNLFNNQYHNHIIENYLASNDPMPNAALHEIGDGDFRAIGAEFLNYMVEFGGLTPQHKVLDIGCGFGRIALPLARYLEPDAGLIGFDIVEEPIHWCKQHVTPLHPNFSFEFLNFQHPLYNQVGVNKSDKGFLTGLPSVANLQPDFATAVSVFTHLDQASIEHYINDLANILPAGGTLFMTAFLKGSGVPPYGANCAFPPNNWEEHGLLTALMGEPLTAAVGIPLEWLQTLLSNVGLLNTQINFGHWRWQRGLSGPFQDILVCTKAYDS